MNPVDRVGRHARGVLYTPRARQRRSVAESATASIGRYWSPMNPECTWCTICAASRTSVERCSLWRRFGEHFWPASNNHLASALATPFREILFSWYLAEEPAQIELPLRFIS